MRALFLLVFTLTVMLAGDSFAQQPATQTLDKLKARNFTVTTLDGKRVSFNDLLEEGKPILLDFWATWCGPCRQEIPHLKELAQKYRKDGLIVIGLNLENPVEDRQAVKNFVRDLKMDYQNVFAPSQIYQFFNGGVAAYRIPQTIVFGADGSLVRRLVGYSPRAGRDILNSAVERAIASGRMKAER